MAEGEAKRPRAEAGEVSAKPPRDRSKMRTGFTTGSCATAAAKAAALALLQQAPQEQVTIHIPAGLDPTFTLVSCTFSEHEARCSVIKDGGDDPDATHGAEIVATVRFVPEPGLHLAGGLGVGVVTKPGLGLTVGGPAINPVPRRMISEHVQQVAGELLQERGLQVEISVPTGEQIAKKTLNARLGIIGGISILGTSGMVIPYSTAAYRASITQGIDVALAQGLDTVVLTTGGRSEKFAQALLPELPEVAFVQMGEFLGFSLKELMKRSIKRVIVAGMVGKFSKVAQGAFMLHVASSQVDTAFLARLAAEAGAPPPLVAEIAEANTARHFQELIQAAGLAEVTFELMARLVCYQCRTYAEGRFPIEAIITDFDGPLLGRSQLLPGEAVDGRVTRLAGAGPDDGGDITGDS